MLLFDRQVAERVNVTLVNGGDVVHPLTREEIEQFSVVGNLLNHIGNSHGRLHREYLCGVRFLLVSYHVVRNCQAKIVGKGGWGFYKYFGFFP